MHRKRNSIENVIVFSFSLMDRHHYLIFSWFTFNGFLKLNEIESIVKSYTTILIVDGVSRMFNNDGVNTGNVRGYSLTIETTFSLNRMNKYFRNVNFHFKRQWKMNSCQKFRFFRLKIIIEFWYGRSILLFVFFATWKIIWNCLHFEILPLPTTLKRANDSCWK